MGTAPPKGLNPSEIPQLVLLTFDDALADWMLPMYERILARRNPNGCPVSMTFYVCHDGGTIITNKSTVSTIKDTKWLHTQSRM